MLHEQMLQNPAYQRIMDLNEAAYQEFVSHPRTEGVTGGVRKIPVVFHFIQCSDNPCVDENEALNQIVVLNEDFRRMSGTPGFGNGVDTEYEFCLATIDPNGCPTTGMNHVVAPQWCYHDQADAAQMKGLIQWPPTQYLNVWVPCSIETANTSGQVIGYATFPFNLPLFPNLDGVVIHADYLGTSNPTYRGRTTTHEVGHWLGLFHTFQNGCQGATANTCAAQGDRVCDTPQAAEANFQCPNINSCTDSPIDNFDQIENYMDYADGVCQNMFTQGQKDRMDFYTNNQRSVLWSPANLTATGCDGTVSAGCTPAPDFVADNVITCAGVPVQFTDLSVHAPTSWSWSFPGGTPSTSTLQNPVVTYSTTGVYDVTLVTTNSIGNATEFKFSYIDVVQPSTSILTQGFEGILVLPQGWMVTDDNGIETWKLTTAARSEGQNSMKVKNFEMRNAGEKMALHSNSFSMQNVTSGYMTFDHSYKKYSGLTSDKLSVDISTDCGATWTEVWSLAGPYLATVAGTAAAAEWVPSQLSHWKSDTVSLDSFAGQSNVKVKFVCHSGGGQSVYLDNINMNVTLVSAPDANAIGWDFQVAPNPFHDDLRISFALAKPEAISFTMTDVSGKVMFRHDAGRQSQGYHQLPLAAAEFRSLPAGVYFLKGETGSGAVTRKLVKMN
ncbi:MAG TPA: M43 family zinc metalloprotease [Bacteroidia bacterium]|nr:M43 family zinc metalloprotease [Bacteroidia bacterium]